MNQCISVEYLFAINLKQNETSVPSKITLYTYALPQAGTLNMLNEQIV